MFATYKLISACTNEEYMKRDLDDLVTEYRETTDARKRNKLISTIFCKLYPMMLKLMQKYYTLTPEQKIEHALYRLVKGLEMYNPKKMKFSSFFYMHFSNHMKTLYTNSLAPCRAAFANIVGNNDEVMRVYTETATERERDSSEQGLLDDIKDASYLSSEEKEYCSCVVAGITKTKEIKERLKLDKRNNFNKPLISNPFEVQKTAEAEKLADKQALLRIKKIKESIKRKHAELKAKGINIFRD